MTLFFALISNIIYNYLKLKAYNEYCRLKSSSPQKHLDFNGLHELVFMYDIKFHIFFYKYWAFFFLIISLNSKFKMICY